MMFEIYYFYSFAFNFLKITTLSRSKCACCALHLIEIAHRRTFYIQRFCQGRKNFRSHARWRRFGNSGGLWGWGGPGRSRRSVISEGKQHLKKAKLQKTCNFFNNFEQWKWKKFSTGKEKNFKFEISTS